ncbi:phosphoethanolamine transferase [Shewanella sp. GXUN23E]|uniref:phosphoethanolamine transferase n=1 Tax=Shewanella sp. GXUN23E TaxID=3422498 RepID=UPI003D7DFF6A
MTIWPKSINKFTFLLALYFVGIFNIPFFDIVAKGLAEQDQISWGFVISIPIFLLCALSILFSFFSIKYLLKPFFIVLTLLSSSVFWAQWQYGVVFDVNMMQNIFQTNQAEASTYLNLASAINMLITGILPAYWIYKAPIEYPGIKQLLKSKAIFILANAIIVVIIGALYFQNFVAFGRNHDEIKRAIVPTYFIGSLAKYINNQYFVKPLPYEQLGTDARVRAQADKPRLLVLMVGETARAQNFSYYGYNKPTNQFTEKDDLLVFEDVTSCGTATAVSLPCMFSRMNREDYNARRAKAQDSLIDVLAHAGIELDWIDNDSGCKGVCDRVPNKLISLTADPKLCDGESCFDQILVDELRQTVTAMDTDPKDTVIVLHMMGSHGPTYYKRYPDDKRLFTPDCQRSDIQNCSHEELINTYDNTIAYSDYILSQVIDVLKTQEATFDTSMLYLSDHGESLGENGLYLHGAPYALAPKEQIHVPMLAWFSPGFIKGDELAMSCIKQKAAQGGWSHDNLFDTVLGLMDVSTSVYRPEQDILAGCYKSRH